MIDPAADTAMESCTISFEAIMLNAAMRAVVGIFDEHLDGNEWCLKDYVRRTAAHGYRTCITGRLILPCAVGQQFGSALRRNEMIQNSRSSYISKWGIPRHYCVYFGKEAETVSLDTMITAILDGARQGHLFTLLLHRRQYSLFLKMGWTGLHTGIELRRLSPLFSLKSLQRQFLALRTASPDLLAVRGGNGILFPGVDTAISHEELLSSICAHTTNIIQNEGHYHDN